LKGSPCLEGLFLEWCQAALLRGALILGMVWSEKNVRKRKLSSTRKSWEGRRLRACLRRQVQCLRPATRSPGKSGHCPVRTLPWHLNGCRQKSLPRPTRPACRWTVHARDSGTIHPPAKALFLLSPAAPAFPERTKSMPVSEPLRSFLLCLSIACIWADFSP
jgi:hypothetical protein